jgi:hypothetical protein
MNVPPMRTSREGERSVASSSAFAFCPYGTVPDDAQCVRSGCEHKPTLECHPWG